MSVAVIGCRPLPERYNELLVWNPTASMRVLEKAGYALEGRRRRAITKDGLTVDRLVYALMRDDA